MLVIGAGPIGIMHCALALMAGAVVYLNDVCTERLEEAKRIYPAINIIKGDPEKELPELTGGRGADAVITACPVPSVQSAALRIAAPEGRVIFFGGVPAAKEPVGIDTNLVHYKQLTLSGTTRASLTQYRLSLIHISGLGASFGSAVHASISLKRGFPVQLSQKKPIYCISELISTVITFPVVRALSATRFTAS